MEMEMGMKNNDNDNDNDNISIIPTYYDFHPGILGAPEPFWDYQIKSEQPGPGFYSFVLVYTVLAFLFIAPLVSWSRNQEEKKLKIILESDLDLDLDLDEQQQPQPQQQEQQDQERKETDRRSSSNDDNNNQLPSADEPEAPIAPTTTTTRNEEEGNIIKNNSNRKQQQPSHSLSVPHRRSPIAMSTSTSEHIGEHIERLSSSSVTGINNNNNNNKHKNDSDTVITKNNSKKKTISRTTVTSSGSRSVSRGSAALRSVVLRELDQSYPDQDPDFQNRILRFSPVGEIPQQKQSFLNNTNTNTQQHSNNNNNNNNGIRQDQQQQRVNNDYGRVSVSHNRASGGGGGGGSKQPAETSSCVPSAATTSKIHHNVYAESKSNNPSDKGFSKLVLDVGGRRWKNRRPIGRVDVIQNVVVNNSEIRNNSSSVVGGGSKTTNNKRESISPPGGPKNSGIVTHTTPQQQQLNQHLNQQRQSRGMSDVASSILSEQHHQLHHQPQIQIDVSLVKKHQLEQLQIQNQAQLTQQQQFLAIHRLQQQQQQRRYSQQRRSGSRSIISERSASAMSSIIDDISPDDAPDANDPGRGNVFIEPDEKYWITEQTTTQQYDHHNKGGGTNHQAAGCCSSPFEGLLSLALPDVEKWNVFKASIPLALGASSEALFRLITIAFISQYLGTDAMIAFVLVGLFVRLTSEELAGAIIDSLSSFVQASMDRTSIDVTKSNFISGQYIQLAVILQVCLNIPLLLVWAFFMEPFIMWLVDDSTIANIAQDYAYIVVSAYLVQATSRTLTVIFHICGHEHFESVIDLIAAAIQVISIACSVVLVDGANLTTVGKIQVLINVTSAVAKIAYPAARGWMRPFRKGLIQNVALWNCKIGIWHLLKATVPLLLGTVLEYGEWELLTLFVRHLGPAEVATWALLGAFWDFFEAWTEGIGEAAANQVAYLLSVGKIDRAKKLCYGAIYMAVTQAVLVTSALYISGQYLVVLFSTNPAIQHIMNNTIVMLGFANVIMAFSQITWSLVGAQGRFRLATFVVFFSRWLVTMPCALICIYVFALDLNAVSGSLVVGYATACCALTFIVLRSDWDRLVRLMQVMHHQPQYLVNSAVNNKQEGKGDVGVGVDDDDDDDDDIIVDDPILGLVNLDDFDDSDDDSDGFGFGGGYDDDDDDVDGDGDDTRQSLSRKDRRGADDAQCVPQTRNSSRQSKS